MPDRERLASAEQLLECAKLGILVVRLEDRRVRFANPRICEMLGYERDELLSLGTMAIHPPDERARVEEAMALQAAGELDTARAIRTRRKDGSLFPADITSAPVDYHGERCLVGIFQDASELEIVTEELRASSRVLEAVLDAIPDVIGLQDRSHRILRYNRAGHEFLGLGPDQSHGKKCFELIGKVRPCEHCATAETYRTRAPAQARKYVEDMGIWLDARSYPVLDENGDLVQVVEHLRDITAEVRAEERLRANEEEMRHMQKMQAIGTLAGGVAHDFNNLLTPILGLASMIGEHPDATDAIVEAAEIIERAAARAAELTQQLLGFAQKGKMREEAVDVHELVREILAMVARTVDRRIHVAPSLCPETLFVLGDPGQLRQAVLNLAVNACDAMPEGGDLTVSTRVGEDNGVVIEVTDTGTGIDPGDVGRIFEPFFTTKAEGKGHTGMGLAMVYGIVENHRGRIEVESRPGATTFRVWMPSTAPTEPVSAPEAVVRGQGCILVIDDEELVRLVTQRMLEALGYEVLAATDGVNGAALFARHRARIDLVIIDLVMPKIGGRETFRRLRAIDPGVRALLSSGYGEDEEVQAILAEGMAGFIKKPFVASELSRAVARALSRSVQDRE